MIDNNNNNNNHPDDKSNDNNDLVGHGNHSTTHSPIINTRTRFISKPLKYALKSFLK